MRKIYHHDAKSVLSEWLESSSVKTIVAVLALELALLLFVTYKGLGMTYLPITLLFMVFTAVSCGVVFHFQADKYLTIIVLILLNFGFAVQVLELGADVSIVKFLAKFLVAIAGALLTAVFYQSFADFLSSDRAVILMMGVQIGICILLSLLGTGAGANIMLTIPFLGQGITLFEVVKVLFPFIAAGLLCKRECRYFQIFKWECKREYILMFYMLVLTVFFVFCSELGTLLVVFLTGLAMLWIYGRGRTFITAFIGMFFTAFVSFWVICDKILLPKFMKEGRSGTLMKLIARFGSALHPEKYWSNAGYQGAMGLQAISVGGTLGIETERYRIELFAASNDFIFANLVQTCGLLIGVIVILFFFALLKRGMDIAFACQDTYFQGVAMGVTLLISVETIIHIGYNTAMLPITGIPLYFLSQGFLAIITGMALITILLVISTGKVRREVK